MLLFHMSSGVTLENGWFPFEMAFFFNSISIGMLQLQ